MAERQDNARVGPPQRNMPAENAQAQPPAAVNANPAGANVVVPPERQLYPALVPAEDRADGELMDVATNLQEARHPGVQLTPAQTQVYEALDQRVRSWGIGDNAINYQRWMAVSPFYTKLIMENVNIQPFGGGFVTDPRAPAICTIYAYGRALVCNMEDVGCQEILACAEFLMPMINQQLLVPEADARVILVEAVQALLRAPRTILTFARSTPTAWQIAIDDDTRGVRQLGHLCDGGAVNVFPAGFPQIFPPDEPFIIQLTPEQAMFYLIWLAGHYTERTVALQMLATTYVACAKQGQATLHFRNKIIRSIEIEMAETITLLPESIMGLFNHFGKEFNDITAPLVFTRWDTLLPDFALRLRLTVQQVAYHRLTVYQVLVEALATFPDFPWPRMNLYFPGEMPNFAAACAAINHNEYYGFKKDLGVAVSTRYKNLGWVAKELLVRGMGKTSLTDYMGWPSRVPHQATVMDIIRRYLDHKGEEGTVAEADIVLAARICAYADPQFNRAQMPWAHPVEQ